MKAGVRVDEKHRIRKSRKNFTASGNVRSKTSYSKKSSHHKLNSKTNYTQKKPNNSNRVVIKITSGSKTRNEVIKHVDYISRDGENEIFSSEKELFLGKEELKEAKESFISFNEKLTDFENDNKTRETFNIVFSLKSYDLYNGDKKNYSEELKDAVYETLIKKYPDNYFLGAIHEDTDNPHIHITINKSNLLDPCKKLDIRKDDLKELKHIFSQELIKREFNVKLEDKPLEEKYKTNDFKVVGFGKANYQFNEDSPQSYYIKYLSNRDNKEVTIWSKNLEKAVIESQLSIGDRINLKKESKNDKGSHWNIKILEKNNKLNNNELSDKNIKPIKDKVNLSDLVKKELPSKENSIKPTKNKIKLSDVVSKTKEEKEINKTKNKDLEK